MVIGNFDSVVLKDRGTSEEKDKKEWRKEFHFVLVYTVLSGYKNTMLVYMILHVITKYN